MRKINFLKTVLSVAIAMLMGTSVFGQFPPVPYTQYDASTTAPTNIDYVTVGRTMGYYALPDPVYHPNYVTTGALTANFTWTWTNTINPGTAATITPGAGVLANYATILYPVIGNYRFTVVENSSAAFGSCSGTTTTMNVTVVNGPVANITTADPAAFCGSQVPATVALSFTEAVPSTLAGYAFGIRQQVENIDAGGAVIGGALSLSKDTLDFPTTGKLETAGGLAGAASPYTWSFTTTQLRVRNGQRTRYTYTLIKASDAAAAAAQGVISAISEKSDYLAIAAGGNANTYAFGAKPAYVVIVNPAPTTGPIYYVPNDFNY